MKTIVYVFSIFGLVAAFPQPETASQGNINGLFISSNFFPAQVGMICSDGVSQKWWCLGVLISDQIAVTAAHCTKGAKNITLLLGYTQMSRGTKFDITNENIIIHENYNAETGDHDISLMKLPRPIKYTPRKNKIAIGVPEPNQTTRGFNWKNTIEAGKLSPIHLKFDSFEVISNDECADYFPVTEGQICVVPATYDPETCEENSFGPLIAKNKLIGIARSKVTECDNASPYVFTYVPAYLDWINLHGKLSLTSN